jgi:hypothetical protein
MILYTGAHASGARAGMEPAGFSQREPGRVSLVETSPGVSADGFDP